MGISATGLMWFEQDKSKSLADRVSDALPRFKARMPGETPAVVYVNPDQYPNVHDTTIAGLTVQHRAGIMPDHLLVAVLSEVEHPIQRRLIDAADVVENDE